MNASFQNQAVRILVVDDEAAPRRFLAVLLGRQGYRVSEAGSIAESMKSLGEQAIDLLISDLRIGGESGIDLIRSAHQNYPEIESILVTAFGSIENAVEAVRAGAFDYITKPYSNEQLLAKVQKALERRSMKREICVLRQHVAMTYGFDNIVGISKVMAQLKETSKRIAPTDITVLITGPSGTGKELFARAIHHHSNRRNGPFIAIDCSAIPEALLESELFGHMKGSFTSAWQSKRGLFEEADGGTIFLDEVSNMPSSTQSKLLRFLQDSEVRAVGSAVSKKVDVRIVAATNRDLKIMVAENSFREDLYYRLNVIPITLPTLAERMEDVEILTEYFLRKISSEMDSRSLHISRRAVDKLISHTWPGNVRELENTLKRGAALCTDGQIDAEDIIFIGSDRPVPAESPLPQKVSLTIKGGLLDNSQRTLILKALDDNQWNFTKTAAELGIGRTTLWRKVRKYNLRQELVSDEVGV